jgi:small-conductance mechanosensitive channel
MNDIIDYLTNDIGILIHSVVIVGITLLINIIANRSFNRLIMNRIKEEDFDATNLRFLQRAISLVILLIGLSFVIFVIPSLQHIATTILAGAGVIVAVIGFASQQVLSNIISGIMIIVTKPYRLKHRIKVRDMEGVVEDITLRHTIIKNYQNKRIVVPNSIMNSEIILNSNLSDDICCEWVEMAVSYTADLRKAKVLMKEEVLAHPLFLDHREALGKDDDDPAPVRVMNVGDSSIIIRAWTWAKNPGDAFVMSCDLKELIKARFEKEGIEIPYPYSNVILRNENDS